MTFSQRFLSTPSARRATFDPGAMFRLFRFLSTPSARRATQWLLRNTRSGKFLSTPSARRATYELKLLGIDTVISIHALREEGDAARLPRLVHSRYFYPRPPRGGRPGREPHTWPGHSDFYPRPPRGGRLCNAWSHGVAIGISIHALREEGDLLIRCIRQTLGIFLSTPSARRATCRLRKRKDWSTHFYPRPPRGGRPPDIGGGIKDFTISIHALREEGDRFKRRQDVKLTIFLSTPSARRATGLSWPCLRRLSISIHALREEGDPGHDRQEQAADGISIHALREEGDSFYLDRDGKNQGISIHALREEGDCGALG